MERESMDGGRVSGGEFTGKWGMTNGQMTVSYWSDKNVLILIVMMMIVQLYNDVNILIAIEL